MTSVGAAAAAETAEEVAERGRGRDAPPARPAAAAAVHRRDGIVEVEGAAAAAAGEGAHEAAAVVSSVQHCFELSGAPEHGPWMAIQGGNSIENFLA